MYEQIDRVIICEHLGLVTPTTVYYRGEKLKTEGLAIEDLVETWRLKFRLSGWICLVLSEKEYQCCLQKTISGTKSVQELLYDQRVICINIPEEIKTDKITGGNIEFKVPVDRDGYRVNYLINNGDHFVTIDEYEKIYTRRILCRLFIDPNEIESEVMKARIKQLGIDPKTFQLLEKEIKE